MSVVEDKLISGNIISALKIALVFSVIYINFLIFQPFLLPVVWAIIIAVALYPLQSKFRKIFKLNSKISSILLVVFTLLVVAVPVFLFADGLFKSLKELADLLESGELVIPSPEESVKDLPVVGEPIYSTWKMFSVNIDKGLEQFQPQVKKTATWLLSSMSDFIKSFFVFLFATVIAGVFLVHTEKWHQIALKVFVKFIGGKGTLMLNNSINTIRSVVTGVLGTAIIQTIIISIGLFAADIRGASILTVVVLICAIVQIPLVVVVLPVIVYAYPSMNGFTAVFFVLWMVLGSVSDNFLKPMLLGRGLDIPMLVILIGSIGGMMLMGIIGLFTGAVFLALGYELFNSWVFDKDKTT